MKDIQATLKRIDEQITGHHQTIARVRVEIAKLQEARLTLMGLAEEDIAAAGYAREERQGVINGSHAKPMLIVRKVGTGDENGSASKAAKNGVPVNKSGNRRGMDQPRGKKPRGSGSHGKYKTALVNILKGGAELSIEAMIARLGEGPKHGKDRQPIYQALYELKRDKVLHSPSGPGSYQIGAS